MGTLKPSKYGNKKVVVDGKEFDSKAESRHFSELQLLEKHGVISNLRCQVKYNFVINGIEIKSVYSRKPRLLGYVADFVYHDNEKNLEIREDVKGHKTKEYKLKAAIMAAMGLPITEVKAR